LFFVVCAGRKNYERIEIHGTEGSILFNLERLNELEIYSSKDPADRRGYRTVLVTEPAHPYMKNWWGPGHVIGWEHTFTHEIYHLVNCIATDSNVAPYGATFYDGLRNNQILEAIAEAAGEERWTGCAP